MIARVPPQNIEAEQAVIGSCLLSHDTAITAISELSAQDFYKQSHVEIFNAILALFSKGLNIDLVTVVNWLRDANKMEQVGGISYLSALTTAVPVKSRIKDFCSIVREKAKARRMIVIADQMSSQCYEGTEVSAVVNECSQEILKIAANETEHMQGVETIVLDVMQEVEAIHAGSKDPFGVPSGFSDLDSLIGGLQRSELTIIAGRPSMGKTTFAMNIVTHAASKGHKSLIFSLEMSRQRLVQKIISSMSGINTKAMDRGFMRDEHWPKFTHAIGKISNLPITIDDKSAQSITQIQAKAKMLAMKQGLDLVMVDYLQLARAKADSREREISEISAGLKALSKDLNIPVIALSQLSRKCEERTDKRPLMSDLRESGSIEQDAGVIAFIYRDDFYNKAPDNPLKGTTEIIVPKNRYGEPGKVDLYFDGAKCMFVNAAREENQNVYIRRQQ